MFSTRSNIFHLRFFHFVITTRVNASEKPHRKGISKIIRVIFPMANS